MHLALRLPVQVKPHVASGKVTAAAQHISNGNAQLALELVGFDQDLGAAMQYVFGNAFICKVHSTRLRTFLASLKTQTAAQSGVHVYVDVHNLHM